MMKHSWRSVWSCAAASALVSISLVSADATQTAGKDKQATTAMKATAGEIANNPAAYIGKKVTVTAEVEDVLGRQVFLLDEDRLFVWPDVLVIAPALAGQAPEDTNVTVSGTVRNFVDVDFRRDYDWNWWGDLDTDIVVAFHNRPVIIADSVKTSSGTELVRR